MGLNIFIPTEEEEIIQGFEFPECRILLRYPG